MGRDDSTNRLFAAARSGHLHVINVETGKEPQLIPIGQGLDDPAFDPASNRIFISSGGRANEVDVYREVDAGHFQLLGKVPTAPGASRARPSREMNRYFVLGAS